MDITILILDVDIIDAELGRCCGEKSRAGKDVQGQDGIRVLERFHDYYHCLS